MSDDPILDDLERVRQLAELARGADGGLITDDTDVASVLNSAHAVMGAMHDEAQMLSAFAAFLRAHADDVAIAGAEDESQAGRDFCLRSAEQLSRVAATVRNAVRSVPTRTLADGPRLVDVTVWEVTDDERETAGTHYVLFEHRAGVAVRSEDEPFAAYADDTAAEHMARQRAEDMPAGIHISVYEADGLELLPDLIYRAAGTGGPDGLVASQAA